MHAQLISGVIDLVPEIKKTSGFEAVDKVEFS